MGSRITPFSTARTHWVDLGDLRCDVLAGRVTEGDARLAAGLAVRDEADLLAAADRLADALERTGLGIGVAPGVVDRLVAAADRLLRAVAAEPAASRAAVACRSRSFARHRGCPRVATLLAWSLETDRTRFGMRLRELA